MISKVSPLLIMDLPELILWEIANYLDYKDLNAFCVVNSYPFKPCSKCSDKGRLCLKRRCIKCKILTCRSHAYNMICENRVKIEHDGEVINKVAYDHCYCEKCFKCGGCGQFYYHVTLPHNAYTKEDCLCVHRNSYFGMESFESIYGNGYRAS